MTAVVSLVDEPPGCVAEICLAILAQEARPRRRAGPRAGQPRRSAGIERSLEMAVERSWRRLDPHLRRRLALQATSAAIGCSWCTDFGYYEGMQTGIDPIKVRSVPRWREASVYTEPGTDRAGVRRGGQRHAGCDR